MRFSTAVWLVSGFLVSCNPRSEEGTRNPARVSCETEVDYQGRNLAARVEVQAYGGVDIATGKQALREIDENTEKFLGRWMTVCKDYRNGALSREQYAEESRRIREKMEELDELALRLEKAESPRVFQQTLRQTYTTIVPDELRADLSIELQTMARRPGAAAYGVTPPGATLGTGSEVYFNISLTEPAHVYLYQVDARDRVTVLFPNPRMSAQNPLPAGQAFRMPPEPGKFVLDDKDLGVEDVHVVASREPIPSIENTLGAGGADQVSAKALECNARGLEFDPGTACPRTRGLVFDGGEPTVEGAASSYSVRAVNAAADNAVHLVYSFHHVGDHSVYGVKNRGIEMVKSAASKRPKSLEQDFSACPGDAALKQMPASGGAWEKWCVEENADGVVVDHGPYRKWHANGRPWVKGQLELGRRVGHWETYGSDGAKTSEADY